MLHTDEKTTIRRATSVAALVVFGGLVIGRIAAAQQDGSLPSSLVSSAASNSSAPNLLRTSAPGIQPVLERAATFQRASQIRLAQAPSGAKTSYSAAHQAFGDLLTSLGANVRSGVDPVSASDMPTVSSQQAAADVRLLKSAAMRAKDVTEGNLLRKAASLYATGAKEYLTGQLREALLETSTSAATPVVLRGDPREADAAMERMKKASQPAPPASKPPAPPTPGQNPPAPPSQPATTPPGIPPANPPTQPNQPPTNPPAPPSNPPAPPSNPPTDPTVPPPSQPNPPAPLPPGA